MSLPVMMGFGGLVLGLFGFFTLRRLADSIESKNKDAAARGTPQVLRVVAAVDLLLLPAIFYFAGTLMA